MLTFLPFFVNSMNHYQIKSNNNETILALGAESDGNFSVFHQGNLWQSYDFGDLQSKENFQKFRKTILSFLKEKKITPNIILTDLHPFYVTTELGQKLAKKFNARHFQIQHHHSHAFSSIGDYIINSKKELGSLSRISNLYIVTMDGTGFGLDEKIWGGEIFKLKIKNKKSKITANKIERVGHLENQILLGGELAIREPARMLLSILSKFLSKEKTFEFMRAYYNQNQFELLYNQLQQNFNCQETSSTGRILDAVSLLLGFCENSRKFKHAPIANLEKNSTTPYSDLKPKISKENNLFILQTTPLFEYLTKNINKDNNRLAATAQQYIAEGLFKIIEKSDSQSQIVLGGGIGNNKIVSEYFHSKGAWKNKKVPRGDAGLSLGQIFCHLFLS